MKKLHYVFFWIYFISTAALGQSYVENGFPSIINFSPKEYDSFRQNWVIAQDERGVMYFGNTDGLLEYDGNSWQLYTVPNKSGILGIAFGPDGKLYAGAQGELGYFLPDSVGRLTFSSLLPFIPKDKRNFSNVTETFLSHGKVYFNAENYILIWNIEKKEFEIIESESGFHILFKVNETIYAREWGKGLKVFTNDTLSPLEGGELFEDERIYSILPFPDNSDTLLIVTRTMGLFKYVNSDFIPFKTEADQFIKENLVYLPGIVLRDGNFLLNTLNGGSILIDKYGNEISRYDHGYGIISNTIYFTFQDLSGGIWLATDNGISRIDYSSPISYFDSRSNITTYTHDIIRHQGVIYAATANGIYFLDPTTSIFHPLKNFNKQSWIFVKAQDDLLVGTTDGLFKLESNQLIPIKRTIGNEFIVNELIQSEVNPNRVFAAVNGGLWSIQKNGKDWIEEGQILEVSDQPTSLAEEKDGSIWMGTFSKGLYKVSFQMNKENIIQIQNPIIENFDSSTGLQDGIVYAEKINEKIYFGTTDSIYQFNEKEKRFFVDTSDDFVANFYDLKAIIDKVPLEQDMLGRVWLGNKKKLAVGKIDDQGNWEWSISPFRRISDEAIYTIYAEKNGITWFASGEKFIRYDFKKSETNKTDFSTIIRNVQIGEDSIIYFGGKLENPSVPELKFKNNSINFRYSASSYEAKNANQFASFLDGFDEDWSNWSTETVKAYTNLPPGNYIFKVKSMNLMGIESSEATYSFIILPIWYRTWWAYLIYATVISLFIYTIVQIRAFYLKKENRILEEKVQHRTRQLNQTLNNLKSTQAQLIQSEKMASLGELTAGIAHEIQNPLNFVNNFSEVSGELIDEMQEEIEKGELEEVKFIAVDLKENLSKINFHGKRAGDIVKGMLEHSRTNKGEKTPTDLNALAEEFLRLSYHGLRAKDKNFNADFQTDLDPNLPKVDVIPQDIGRVLLNLINNAFYACAERSRSAVNEKATSENKSADYQPTVKVSTSQFPPQSLSRDIGRGKGGYIEIKVSDNGSGIPDSIKEKIFQPFFTTKPTGSGTGLGLSLSYDIVKAHGGEIKVTTVESEGTTMIIYLPSYQ